MRVASKYFIFRKKNMRRPRARPAPAPPRVDSISINNNAEHCQEIFIRFANLHVLIGTNGSRAGAGVTKRVLHSNKFYFHIL